MLSQAPSLWHFASEVYTNSSVSSACLALQDVYGVNTPFLLFCCWVGWRHGQLPEEVLQNALSFSNGWSANTSTPLRSIRRDMKSSYSPSWPITEDKWVDLREQVKTLELESEKTLLETLSQLVSSLPKMKGGVDSAIANMRICFHAKQDDKEKQLFVILLASVFTVPEATVLDLIDK